MMNGIFLVHEVYARKYRKRHLTVHPGSQDDGRRSRRSTRAQHPQGQGERSCETSIPGFFLESIPREEPGCISHRKRPRCLDEFLPCCPTRPAFPTDLCGIRARTQSLRQLAYWRAAAAARHVAFPSRAPRLIMSMANLGRHNMHDFHGAWPDPLNTAPRRRGSLHPTAPALCRATAAAATSLPSPPSTTMAPSSAPRAVRSPRTPCNQSAPRFNFPIMTAICLHRLQTMHV